MPFKSKAQRRYFHWAEAHGKLPKGTAEKWEGHTPKKKKLPERVGKRNERVSRTSGFKDRRKTGRQ